MSPSPFADARSEPARVRGVPITPFLSESELEDGLLVRSLDQELLSAVAFELYDHAFDRTVDELTRHAVRRVQGLRRESVEDELRDDVRVERMLREEFRPFARAGEELLDELVRRSEGADLTNLEGADFDRMFALAPTSARAELPLEQFLGGLVRKAKKVAGAAVSLAKKGAGAALKLGLGPVLAKLKALVRPLLEKVLAFALDKIPAPYRPAAEALARRFGMKVQGAVLPKLAAPPTALDTQPAADGSEADYDAALEPAVEVGEGVQDELDAMLSEALLSEEVAPLPSQPQMIDNAALKRLHGARARLVEELGAGEPGPAIEQFLPALLPVLKLGVKLAGRPRVVSFLGNLLGKLIAPLTGAALAPRLGSLIADLGMRTFLQTELHERDTSSFAQEALVHTLEDTVRRVVQLPQTVLDHEGLLESHALEAFELAARQHLPGAVFKGRAMPRDGVWVGMPRRGPRYFKKWSRPFPIALTQTVARTLPSGGGGHLGAHLHDRFEIAEHEALEGTLALFELLPGGRTAHIAASTSSVLHPLTTDAAGKLLGRPELGRDVEGGSHPERPRVGERFYSLDFARAGEKAGHETRWHVQLDAAAGRAQVIIALGERTAQDLSSLLRKRARPVQVVSRLRRLLGAPGVSIAGGDKPSALIGLIRLWTMARLCDHLERAPQDFVSAADQPALGLTLSLRFADLPRDGGAESSMPEAAVQIVAGVAG